MIGRQRGEERMVILMALAVAVVASLSPQNTKRIEWKERIEGIATRD